MIYFCIPALNEERTVGVVLWKLRQIMTELQRDFQIIVVDDASTDATPEVLSPYARVLPLTLIRNEQQLGFAASMEIAIREAVRRSPYPKRDALITLQADFTEDPECVPSLIKRIEAGADVVTTALQPDDRTPAAVRRARRVCKWLVRGRPEAEFADPFGGPRAYRAITIKRALDARGAARVLSWDGWAANAELLAQTLPHSRRNDTVETGWHYRRQQRASRFRLFATLRQVWGLRSGKPSHAAPVTLPDTTIVVPAALAVELATPRRHEAGRRPDARKRDDVRSPRERTRRPPEARPRDHTRKDRLKMAARPEAPTGETEDQPPLAAAPVRDKRRRRARRRRKPLQSPGNGTSAADAMTNGAAEPASAVAPAEGARKKSRRGRRGGRGRKRAPRANGEGQQVENNQDSAGDAS